METKELLGLDVGEKHIGVARASSIAALAEPLTTINTAEDFKELKQMIKDSNVDSLVIGLPRNLQGDDTAQTKWVRDWVVHAKQHLGLPFYWQDEALTSKLAQMHKSPANKPVDEHAMAAAIILQDFLNTPEAERVIC